jgi:[acyl-carrier-protein] S-malonyltransferase
MRTVFLYPGLNGLLKKEDRFRYTHLPQVKKRLGQVQNIFKGLGEEFSFEEYFNQNIEEIYSVQNICRAATAICAIQVGVTDYLMGQYIKPQWMVGCSLGDLARSISAGVCDFEDCIEGYIRFAKNLNGIEKIGANIGVSKRKTGPTNGTFSRGPEAFEEAEISDMNNMGLDVSIMTPYFLNIGGTYSLLEQFEKMAQEKNWRVVKILNYPAHSRYIADYVARASERISHVPTREPKIKLFSSISCKQVSDPQELKLELVFNMTKPLRWGEALVRLEKQEGPLRFINIGPCQSISKMIQDLPLKSQFQEAIPEKISHAPLWPCL